MPSNEGTELEELFAFADREAPRRTYSHKGKNVRAASFPALKPPSTDPGPRLRLFRVGRAKSWEVKQAAPVITGQLQTVQGEPSDTNGDGSRDNSIHEADTHSHDTAEETRRSSIEDPDEISSPVTPPHSQVFDEPEKSEVLEAEDEDDSDPIAILQPLNHNRRDSKQSHNQTKGPRLRPFLIFDKVPAKGYKQLEQKPSPKTVLPNPKFQPGDGFSGREAKPNGLNFLTRNGKQTVTSPHLGILDLTQSGPPTKQKRSIRKANLDDNSFAPASKKTRRRPETDDARGPEKGAKVQPTMKKNSSAPKATAPATTTHPGAQRKETEHAQKHPPQGHPTQEVPQDKAPRNALQARLDSAIIEWNANVQEELRKTSKGPGRVEDQDSYETHVSDTPPRRLRASSESSAASPRRDGGGVPGGTTTQRVFRRFNTQ